MLSNSRLYPSGSSKAPDSQLAPICPDGGWSSEPTRARVTRVAAHGALRLAVGLASRRRPRALATPRGLLALHRPDLLHAAARSSDSKRRRQRRRRDAGPVVTRALAGPGSAPLQEPPEGTVSVRLSVPFASELGDVVLVTGSAASLGWDTETAPRMRWQPGNVCAATLALPPDATVEYKIVVSRAVGGEYWLGSTGENDVLTTRPRGEYEESLGSRTNNAAHTVEDVFPRSEARDLLEMALQGVREDMKEAMREAAKSEAAARTSLRESITVESAELQEHMVRVMSALTEELKEQRQAAEELRQEIQTLKEQGPAAGAVGQEVPSQATEELRREVQGIKQQTQAAEELRLEVQSLKEQSRVAEQLRQEVQGIKQQTQAAEELRLEVQSMKQQSRGTEELFDEVMGMKQQTQAAVASQQEVQVTVGTLAQRAEATESAVRDVQRNNEEMRAVLEREKEERSAVTMEARQHVADLRSMVEEVEGRLGQQVQLIQSAVDQSAVAQVDENVAALRSDVTRQEAQLQAMRTQAAALADAAKESYLWRPAVQRLEDAIVKEAQMRQQGDEGREGASGLAEVAAAVTRLEDALVNEAEMRKRGDESPESGARVAEVAAAVQRLEDALAKEAALRQQEDDDVRESMTRVAKVAMAVEMLEEALDEMKEKVGSNVMQLRTAMAEDQAAIAKVDETVADLRSTVEDVARVGQKVEQMQTTMAAEKSAIAKFNKDVADLRSAVGQQEMQLEKVRKQAAVLADSAAADDDSDAWQPAMQRVVEALAREAEMRQRGDEERALGTSVAHVADAVEQLEEALTTEAEMRRRGDDDVRESLAKVTNVAMAVEMLEEALDDAKGKLGQKMEQMQIVMAEDQAVVAKVNENVVSLGSTVEDVEKRVGRKVEQLQASVTVDQAAIAKIDEKVAELTSTVKAVETSVDQKMDEVHNVVVEDKTAIAQVGQSVIDLRSTVEGVEARVQQKVEQMQLTLGDDKSAIAKVDQKVDELKTKVGRQETQLLAVRTQTVEAAKESERWRPAMQRLVDALAKEAVTRLEGDDERVLGTNVAEVAAALARLEEALAKETEARQKGDDARERAIESAANFGEIAAAVDNLESTLEAVEGRLEKKMEQMRTAAAEDQAAVAKVDKSVANLRTVVNRQETQLAKVRTQAAAFQKAAKESELWRPAMQRLEDAIAKEAVMRAEGDGECAFVTSVAEVADAVSELESALAKEAEIRKQNDEEVRGSVTIVSEVAAAVDLLREELEKERELRQKGDRNSVSMSFEALQSVMAETTAVTTAVGETAPPAVWPPAGSDTPNPDSLPVTGRPVSASANVAKARLHRMGSDPSDKSDGADVAMLPPRFSEGEEEPAAPAGAGKWAAMRGGVSGAGEKAVDRSPPKSDPPKSDPPKSDAPKAAPVRLSIAELLRQEAEARDSAEGKEEDKDEDREADKKDGKDDDGKDDEDTAVAASGAREEFKSALEEKPTSGTMTLFRDGVADAAGTEDAREGSRSVEVSVGSSMVPQADKADTGGEDAVVTMQQGHTTVVAVFDGVGSWDDAGVDAGCYSRALARAVEASVEGGEVVPQRLLERAHKEALAPGSSTALVASLDAQTGRVQAANLGDCGLWHIRRGVVIAATAPHQHSFNFPYQLACEALGMPGDKPSETEEYGMAVRAGDALVLASDGLADNLFEDDIAAIVQAADWKAEGAATHIAAELAARAHKLSNDSSYMSPFAVALNKEQDQEKDQERGEGLSGWLQKAVDMATTVGYVGGKVDDISVVVVLIA